MKILTQAKNKNCHSSHLVLSTVIQFLHFHTEFDPRHHFRKKNWFQRRMIFLPSFSEWTRGKLSRPGRDWLWAKFRPLGWRRGSKWEVRGGQKGVRDTLIEKRCSSSCLRPWQATGETSVWKSTDWLEIKLRLGWLFWFEFIANRNRRFSSQKRGSHKLTRFIPLIWYRVSQHSPGRQHEQQRSLRSFHLTASFPR